MQKHGRTGRQKDRETGRKTGSRKKTKDKKTERQKAREGETPKENRPKKYPILNKKVPIRRYLYMVSFCTLASLFFRLPSSFFLPSSIFVLFASVFLFFFLFGVFLSASFKTQKEYSRGITNAVFFTRWLLLSFFFLLSSFVVLRLSFSPFWRFFLNCIL